MDTNIKIAALVAQGFESTELVTVINILKRADLSTVLISVHENIMVSGLNVKWLKLHII